MEKSLKQAISRRGKNQEKCFYIQMEKLQSVIKQIMDTLFMPGLTMDLCLFKGFRSDSIDDEKHREELENLIEVLKPQVYRRASSLK